MRNILLSLIVSCFLVINTFAYAAGESSEDTYTLDEACMTGYGNHFGQIPDLEYRGDFDDILSGSEYLMGGFHRYLNKLFFTITDPNLPQSFSHLIQYNCTTKSLEMSTPLHGREAAIQYSPEVSKVTSRYILMEDWQNVSGKSEYVSMILDRQTYKLYYIRGEFLKNWNRNITEYVGANNLNWNIVSYSRGIANVKVRLSPTKSSIFSVSLR